MSVFLTLWHMQTVDPNQTCPDVVSQCSLLFVIASTFWNKYIRKKIRQKKPPKNCIEICVPYFSGMFNTPGMSSLLGQMSQNPQLMQNMLQAPYMQAMLESMSANPALAEQVGVCVCNKCQAGQILLWQVGKFESQLGHITFVEIGHEITSMVILSLQLALVAQLDAPSDWRSGVRGFNPSQGWQHSFVEIDHEIFSTVILSLLLIQEGQLSVSGERMCTILVNHLED